jgi:integrase
LPLGTALAAAVRLLALTGARAGEVLGLPWEHVDLQSGCLRLPMSKTGRKVIHLNEPAIEVLAELAERKTDNPWVIEGAKPGSPLVNIRKPWHRLREAAEAVGTQLGAAMMPRANGSALRNREWVSPFGRGLRSRPAPTRRSKGPARA